MKPIKQWAIDDRPREKLMERGSGALSNAELLAILIGSGSSKESAVELSKRIFSESNNSISELSRLSLADLKKFKGIGDAKAITIMAALELGRRRASETARDFVDIKSSNDAYINLKPYMNDLKIEECYLLLLNRANRVIKIVRHSQGGSVGTVFDVRVILKEAIENNATSLIIAHNHPSGNLKPSEQDLAVTKKILESGKIMDIQLLDHLIIVSDNYFSFADNNLI